MMSKLLCPYVWDWMAFSAMKRKEAPDGTLWMIKARKPTQKAAAHNNHVATRIVRTP